MKRSIVIVLYTFLLFSYIYQYDLSFLGFPEAFHSQRLASVLIVFLAVCKRLSNNPTKRDVVRTLAYRNYKKYSMFISLLLLYSYFLLVLFGEGDGVHIFDHVLNIALFTLPTIWALPILFEDIKTFCLVALFTGIIQSALVLMCTFNDAIGLAIDSTFNRNLFDFTREHRHAYAGGIGCITSTGVVKFSTCLCAALYMYYTFSHKKYLVLFFLLSIVSCMIARTGLVFFVVGMLFLIANSGKFTSYVSLFVYSLVIFFIIYFAAANFLDLESIIGTRFNRFISLRETGLSDGFFRGYFYGDDTFIPPLGIDTLLGTGLTTGVSSLGYYVHVDGGPLRIYSAVGLPFCLIVYTFLFRIMIKTARMSSSRSDRLFIYMMFCYFLIADFKELSLFQIWPMCFFFTVSILIHKKQISI